MIDDDPHDMLNLDSIIREIQLGDAFGRDDQLAGGLVRFEETIREDIPGNSGYRACELLAHARNWAPAAWSKLGQLVEWGITRFTKVELVRAKAKATVILADAAAYEKRTNADAAAYEKRTNADADAKIKMAFAEEISAQTVVTLEQGTAVAKEQRAKTRRSDQLLKQMKERGIDFDCKLEDGILLVAFTKSDPPAELPAIDPPDSGD